MALSRAQLEEQLKSKYGSNNQTQQSSGQQQQAASSASTAKTTTVRQNLENNLTKQYGNGGTGATGGSTANAIRTGTTARTGSTAKTGSTTTAPATAAKTKAKIQSVGKESSTTLNRSTEAKEKQPVYTKNLKERRQGGMGKESTITMPAVKKADAVATENRFQELKAANDPTQKLSDIAGKITQNEQQLTDWGLQLNRLQAAYENGDASAATRYNALVIKYNKAFDEYTKDIDAYNKLYNGAYRDSAVRGKYATREYMQQRQANRDLGARRSYQQRLNEEEARAPQETTLRRKGASVGEHSYKRLTGEEPREAGYTFTYEPTRLQQWGRAIHNSYVGNMKAAAGAFYRNSIPEGGSVSGMNSEIGVNDQTKAAMQYWSNELLSSGREQSNLGAYQTKLASQGLGTFGTFIVDASIAGIQMLMDMGISVVTGGSMLPAMFVRSMGGGYLTAEQMGASSEEALAYGIGVGAVEALSEKMFSVFSIGNRFAKGAVNKEMSERIIDRLLKNMTLTPKGKTALNRLFTILFATGSEGLEEVAAGIMEPVIRKITMDPKLDISSEIDWQEALYEGLIGGLLGGIGGAVDLVNTKGTYWKYYKEGLTEGIDRYVATAKKYGIGSEEALQAAKDIWTAGNEKLNGVAGFIVGANADGTGGEWVPLIEATQETIDNGLPVTFHQVVAQDALNNYEYGVKDYGIVTSQDLNLRNYLNREENARKEAENQRLEAARREEAARLEAEEKARVATEKPAQTANPIQTAGASAQGGETVRLDTARSAQTRAQAPQGVAESLRGIPEEEMTQEEKDELQYGSGAVENLGQYTGLARRMGQPLARAGRALRTPGVQQQAANLQQRVGGLSVAYKAMRSNMPGYVDRATGTIYLNSNLSKEKLQRSTLGHELVHFLKTGDPQLIDDIIAYMGRIGEDVQGEIARLRPLYEKEIRNLYAMDPAKMQEKLAELDEPGYFEEEVAANFIGRICEEQSETLDRLAAEEPGLLQRIVAALRRFLRELGATPEAQERIEVYEQAIARVNAALAKAGQETETGQEDTRHLFTEEEGDASELAPDELAPDELPADLIGNLDFGDDVRFNLRSMEEDKEDFRKDLAGIMDEADLDELFNTIDEVMDFVSQFQKELDYGADLGRDNRPFLPVKPNSDEHYKFAIDYSTLCRKRILTQAITERLQKELGRGLTPMESVRIREELIKLRDAGAQIDVACALCYVEAARFNAMKYINDYLADPRAVMIDYLAKKNRTWIRDVLEPMQQRYWESLGKTGKYNKQKLNTEQQTKINEENKKLRATYEPESEREKALLQRLEEIDKNQFLSVDGLTKLASDEDTYPIYDAFITFLRDRGRSKAQESRSPYYKGDLMRATSGGKKLVTAPMIQALNEESGSRMQSWSDFEAMHMLDLMSSIMDLALNNAKAHCYTKVPDLVRVGGLTGVMYNMSLIPAGDTGLNAEGKLDASCYDPHEGMPFEVMQELRDEFPDTAGNICIGINDAQIRALMASPDIDFIIPYHESGLPKELKALLGLHDWDSYQSWQNEKPDTNKKGDRKKPALKDWFSIEEARSFDGDGYAYMEYASRKYLKYCDEHGLVPVFPMFTGEDHLTPEPGYWKLLIDRKMVNQKTGEIIEQQVVRPKFNKDTLLDVLNREIDSDVRRDQQMAIDTVVERVLSGQTSLSQQMDQDLQSLGVLLKDAPMLNAVEKAGKEKGEDIRHRFLPEEEETGEQTKTVADETTPEAKLQATIQKLTEQVARLTDRLDGKESEAPVSQAINSAKTSIKQIPALFRNKNVEFGETNIDIGGGRFDLATDYLKSIGTENMVFDPYNRSAETNSATLRFLQEGNKADTATCANVLNVIREPEARANVILEAAKAIKPDGAAYFMVYEGDSSGTGKQTSSGWQNNRPTASYVSEIEQYFGNVTRQGKLITAREPIADLPQAAWEIEPGSAVRFSFVEGEEEETQGKPYDYTKPFSEQLDDYENGTFPEGNSFFLGGTPDVLKRIGLLQLPLTIDARHISYALHGTYSNTNPDRVQDHIISKEELAKLPEKIADPIAIIEDRQWPSKEASQYKVDVIVSMIINGKQSLVPISINTRGHFNGLEFDVNGVSTAHGNVDTLDRLRAAIEGDREDDIRVYYVNKEKTTKVLPSTGNLISSAAAYVPDGFVHSITDAGSPVKMRISSVTESQQFKRWFRNSKVVDENGQPLRVYHTTDDEFYIFDRSHLGKTVAGNATDELWEATAYVGFWFNTQDLQRQMVTSKTGEFYLSIRNPLELGSIEELTELIRDHSTSEDPKAMGEETLNWLQRQGYDGLKITDEEFGGTSWVAFENTQIKSATDNIGTFDRNNPDVRYSFTEEEGTEEEAPKNLGSMEPSERSKELIAAGVKAKQKSREAEKILRSLRLTPKENALANDILAGTLTLNELRRSSYDQPVDKSKVERAYEAKKAAREAAAPVEEYNRARREGNINEAEELIKDSDEWKDKKNFFAYSRETGRRIFQDLTKDTAQANALTRTYIDPIREHEAEKNRMVSRYNDRIKALKIETRVRHGNKVSEAYAIQYIGELEFIRDWLEQLPEGETRGDVTYQEAMTLLHEFWAENPNLDQDRIHAAVAEFRSIYDEIFAMVNEARVLNGYAPIDYRKGYFPHFTSDTGDNIIESLARGMGLGVEVTELPTSIAGTTHLFRPGIQWSGHMLSRTGNKTDYNVLEGWDRYIPAVANIIYHTEDIQRLRALETAIRHKYSDTTVRDEIDATRRSRDLTAPEINAKLDELFKRDVTQLNYFVQWLREYTNQLAGKKAELDRNVEKFIGRKFYRRIQQVENRVAANMLGGNISSAMTNFVPLFQAWANVRTSSMMRAMWDTGVAAIRGDGFRDGSDFLINRRGYDAMYQTLYGKTKNALFIPFNIIDDFVSETIVRARYYDELHNNPMISPEVALANADTFAGSVLADRAIGELPVIFNSKNPLVKVFTMFQVEVNNDLSHLLKDIPREARQKGMAALVMSILKYMLGVYMFNDLFEWLFGRRVSLDPLDMLNDLVGDATGYQLPNMFESAVLIAKGEWDGWEEFENGKGGNFLSDLVADMKEWADDLPFISGLLGGGRFPIQAMLPDEGAVKAGWEATRDILKGEEDQENPNEYDLSKMYKAIKNPLWYWVSPAFGGQARKIAEGIHAYTQHGSYSQTKQGKVLQYPILDYRDLVKAMVFGKTTTRYGKEWVKSDFDSLTVPQTEAYINLVAGGSDPQLVYEILHDLKGTDRTAAEKAYSLATAKLEDGERVELFGALDRSGEADKFADLMSAGLSFRQCAEVLDEWTPLKAKADLTAEGDEGKPERTKLATQFAGWLDEEGYTDEQKKVILDNYKLGASPIRYDWLVRDGISNNGALELAMDWSELTPEAGKNSVSANQKIDVVADAGYLTEKEKHIAVRSLLSDDVRQEDGGSRQTDYDKYVKGYDISVEVFNQYLKVTTGVKGVDRDGDGKTDSGSKRDALFAAINTLPLQPGQKTALALYQGDYSESSIRKNAPWLR